MKSILRLPEVYIIGVLLLFFSHVLIRWRKESRKSNLLFVAFVTIITVQFFLLAPIMNSKILLDAFKADKVQFKSESIDVSADIGKVFSNEFGVKIDRESLFYRIQNWDKKHYMEMNFWKGKELVLKLKLYPLENENEYSGMINGIDTELRWNGYRIKYNEKVYKNIDEILLDFHY